MKNDKARKAIAIGALAELYRRQMTDAAIEMFVSALGDLTAEQVEHAARKAAASCKFMPAPVELRELAGKVSHADRAMLAFQALELAIEEIGGYRSPDFDDPAINAIVRHLGGWTRLCAMPCDEFDRFLRPQFLKAYEAISRNGVGSEAGARLIGEFERENARMGYNRPGDIVPVKTGLPWADETRRLGERRTATGTPRIEFQKP